MVEALICGQNWLRPSSAPIYLCAAMDDVEEFEKLDGGMTIICYIKKIWLSISLFIKKNFACLLLLKKKRNWMSWILGIFIFLLYKWLLCFFFFFLFVELVSDVALTSELGMSTPTPIEVDGWRLFCAFWTGGIDEDMYTFWYVQLYTFDMYTFCY